MLLAFQISDVIRVPFGWLLDWLNRLTGQYGLAIILFAIIVQLVLLPITMKSKKGMMKMSRLTPRIQAIKDKYPNDQQKQNEAIQQLQKEEGASLGCGGCLWSLVPMLILIPLYNVIRMPITYMLHETDANVVATIVNTVKGLVPSAFNTQNAYYEQVIAASYIKEYQAEITAALEAAGQTLKNARTIDGLDFNFLKISLGSMPEFNVFGWSKYDWAHIGLFLIPVLSAGSQVLSMFISQKMNDSVITDKNGLQDKEAAKNSQSAQTSKVMMWMMPAMSLWIGFTVPAALSLYWFVGGVIRMVEDVILTKHYRKIYDAEDAERLARHLEEEAAEAEKERLRAEKRAANPDGITENTSKKKLQKQQQQADAAAKAAAKKEYDAKKGIVEEATPEQQAVSGIPQRPNCRGRAYDPNRYTRENTEE